MKVLHVITGIRLKGGGPSRSSQRLIAVLCKAGVDAWIYSFDNADPWIPGMRKIILEHSNTTPATLLRKATFGRLASPNGRTILQEMGQYGHQLVSARYTWSAVCDKIVRGYEEVLK